MQQWGDMCYCCYTVEGHKGRKLQNVHARVYAILINRQSRTNNIFENQHKPKFDDYYRGTSDAGDFTGQLWVEKSTLYITYNIILLRVAPM